MMHRSWQCRSIAAVVLLFFPYAAKRLFELTHPGWVEWLAIDYGARTIMLAGAVVARPTIGWRRFATLTAAVASVVLFMSLVLDPVLSRAFRGTAVATVPLPWIENPAVYSADLLFGLWLVALSEELAFRWYAIRRLERLGYRPNAVILLSAVLFAAFHTTRGVQVVAFSFLLGVLFGFLYQRTGRLWPVVVGHYVVDFIAFSGIAVRLHE
jgi:uncharacterized protein